MTAHAAELSAVALTVLAVVGLVTLLFLAVLVPLRCFGMMRNLVRRVSGNRRSPWRAAAALEEARRRKDLDGKRLGPRGSGRDA